MSITQSQCINWW